MLSILKIFGIHSSDAPEFLEEKDFRSKSRECNFVKKSLNCVIDCGIEEATTMASDCNGLLFIVFHDPQSADSRDFVEKSLCDKKFTEYMSDVSFKTAQILLFDVSNHAHLQVAKMFGIQSCPAVVIKTKLQSKFQTILSYEGYLESQQLVGLVQSVLLAAEAEYAQAEELNSIRSLQREQDEAYRRSVEADLAKRRSRTASSDAPSESGAETSVSEATSDPSLNNRIMQAKMSLSKVEASETTYRIQFVLPNGSRKVASFGPETTSTTLFDHLFANNELTSTAVVIKSIDPVFELKDDKSDIKISDIQGLGKSFKLFVEYL